MTIVTVRGQGVCPKVEKILLFGDRFDFDYGYKILEFKITSSDPQGSNELSATLNTVEVAHSLTWEWDKNTQVGWAGWNIPTNSRFGDFSEVDEEVIVVSDLFIDFSGSTDQVVNYKIVLERVPTTDSLAALSMVNTGQGMN